jgi:hypothetical protein
VGVVRYYWVVLKLGITVFAAVILLIYMGTFRQMAGVAADPVVDLEVVRNASPIVHAILALVLLVAAWASTSHSERPLMGSAGYGSSGVRSRRSYPQVLGQRVH